MAQHVCDPLQALVLSAGRPKVICPGAVELHLTWHLARTMVASAAGEASSWTLSGSCWDV
jgi:hypothetical protein